MINVELCKLQSNSAATHQSCDHGFQQAHQVESTGDVSKEQFGNVWNVFLCCQFSVNDRLKQLGPFCPFQAEPGLGLRAFCQSQCDMGQIGSNYSRLGAVKPGTSPMQLV